MVLIYSTPYSRQKLMKRYYSRRGSGSVVGIATSHGLDGLRIESRWGTRFSTPVQTGPEAHPASCTMDTGSFPGVRCGRGVTLTPHPLLVPRSKIEYSYIATLPKGSVAYERVKPTILGKISENARI
jgi:hypothetical protein